MITENLCENWSQKSDSMLYLIWSGQYWRKNIKLFKCCTVLLGTCVFDHSPDNTLFCSLKFVERHILFSKIKQDYYTVNTTANNVFESLFGKIVFMSEEVRNSKLSLFFWLDSKFVEIFVAFFINNKNCMLQVACTKYNRIVQLQSNILELSLKHFHNWIIKKQKHT